MTESDSKGWYNGFCWNERNRKLQAYKRGLARGEVQPPSGVCALCGDPEAPLEYHDEDYSEPYVWAEPAAYGLCNHCHVHKLHKRFKNPNRWFAFLAHVQRGGYARELKDPIILREVEVCQRAIQSGITYSLRPLRPYRHSGGKEWFVQLTMDPRSLTQMLASGAESPAP
jgi:hypothetical protein